MSHLPATGAYAIETRNLTKRYGRMVAVDQLTLQVPRGALFGFIGPNGAGKTTTLRMLAGLLECTAGDVWLGGQQLAGNLRAAHRLIGYMPDFFGVYDDMLVWEYLDFFARCHQVPAARRKVVVDDLLDLVNLADKRTANVQALSRGMQQRLCLAHALVHDPQILLLDEPASGLDPRARVEMRELLKELAAMGKTLIVSSHILAELAEMCTQVGIIQKGRLVAGGTLEGIRRQMQMQRLVRVRILAEPAAALALAHSCDLLRGSEPVVVDSNGKPGTTLEVALAEDHAAAALLTELVTRGAAVADFREAGNDLEDLFLQLTQEG
jgi:ABC-2 type transport system ATP-binding protein